jgi:hypothetical protein
MAGLAPGRLGLGNPGRSAQSPIAPYVQIGHGPMVGRRPAHRSGRPFRPDGGGFRCPPGALGHDRWHSPPRVKAPLGAGGQRGPKPFSALGFRPWGGQGPGQRPVWPGRFEGELTCAQCLFWFEFNVKNNLVDPMVISLYFCNQTESTQNEFPPRAARLGNFRVSVTPGVQTIPLDHSIRFTDPFPWRTTKAPIHACQDRGFSAPGGGPPLATPRGLAGWRERRRGFHNEID